MLDLNTLITNPTDLYLTEANFITDRANGFLPGGEARAAALIPEDDASNLTLDANLANGAPPTVKPLPPTREMLRSLNSQSIRLESGTRGLCPGNDAPWAPTIAQMSRATLLRFDTAKNPQVGAQPPQEGSPATKAGGQITIGK